MKKRIILSLWFTMISMHTWAQNLAQDLATDDPGYDHSWYLGAAFGAMNYQQDNINAFGLEDHRLIIGKQLNRIWAVELHLGNSSSDTQIVSGVPVTLKVDNYEAGFIKANLTFSYKDWKYNRFRLYGMLGGTRLQATSSDTVVSSTDVKTSAAAGIGMEFLVDNFNVQLGYTRYINRSSNGAHFHLDSLHLGVIYIFGQDRVVNAR